MVYLSQRRQRGVASSWSIVPFACKSFLEKQVATVFVPEFVRPFFFSCVWGFKRQHAAAATCARRAAGGCEQEARKCPPSDPCDNDLKPRSTVGALFLLKSVHGKRASSRCIYSTVCWNREFMCQESPPAPPRVSTPGERPPLSPPLGLILDRRWLQATSFVFVWLCVCFLI